MRMKCLRILPEIWARTLRWPGRSTRNIVPGNTCVTVPSVTICSSFGIARDIIAAQASLNQRLWTARLTAAQRRRLPFRDRLLLRRRIGVATGDLLFLAL